MAMVAVKGADGVPQDIPVIAYTEKVIEEKELELRKYIQDNYLKIRNVEKELAELTLQIKLTAGPKKAALELLRKKIEQSGEKIKKVKLKEEQAKKVWDAAQKELKDAEDEKQRLCDDLTRLVEESGAAQFSRLEELKRKLQALNPDLSTSMQPPNVIKPPNDQLAISVENCEHAKDIKTNEDTPKDVKLSSSAAIRGRSRGRGRSSLHIQPKAGGQTRWTGGGFDTD